MGKLRASAVTAAMVTLMLVGGGLAERSRAASSTNSSQAAAKRINLQKVEKKLLKVNTSLVKLQRLLPKTYLKISSADSTFLKISDANAQFLKTTDADQRYLPAAAANSFVQGNGNVVSGALPTLSTLPQQLLSLPGGALVVSAAEVPLAGTVITIHNGTPSTLAAVRDMGDGNASTPFTFTPNGDTSLPGVSASGAEIRVQVFPGGGFSDVVSILIGLAPNPSTNQPEVVGQAFMGGA